MTTQHQEGHDTVDTQGRTMNMWKDLLALKRKAVIQEKMKDIPIKNDEETTDNQGFWENQVRYVDKTFLTRKFTPQDSEINNYELIEEVVRKFSLNTEQERAFRIIANHSLVGMAADPLRMYIGGMAGTGKSQVIKALIHFFEQRGKSYAFLILAPTGSAASLVSGSTYHSVLGFRGVNKLDDEGNQKGDPLAKGMSAQDTIRNRIKAVDYVFIDEISMVDCLALYNISAQMNLAMRIDDVAFAGKSMIFAGDFGQLPPLHTSGPALYNPMVSSVIHTTNSVSTQKKSIGKALWHQFTVVVLLKQNMRQTSEEDQKFRKLLVNLRMNSCDVEDLELMHSRVPHPDHPDIDMDHPDVRHSNMITCWNTNRDLLNEIGVLKFAKAHDRQLYTFYAYDTFSNTRITKGKATLEHNPLRAGNSIPSPKAAQLLNILPGNTGHIAGKLSVCKGMPVIIKRNDATELNVTNGAEGFVCDWMASTSPIGQPRLDVLFVELKNPPTPVKLDGLPLNVVPICRKKENIQAILPDDTALGIIREQVPILPNFAMTDYASQGRTRAINIVDLEQCKSHQSVYTCLSRASTLKGTIIFRMCPQAKVTGGLSGYLQQEFRELELLNEITRLRWEGNLKPGIGGNTRSTLLKSYFKAYGKARCPSNVHPAVRWGKPGDKTLSIDYDDDDNFVWKNLDAKSKESKNKKTTPADNNISSKHIIKKSVDDVSKKVGVKRKANDKEDNSRLRTDIVHITKKQKTRRGRPETFRGLQWRSSTQSCAYDAILTIISNIYYHNPRRWNENMEGVNMLMTSLVSEWTRVLRDISFDHAETIRNTLQATLNAQDPYSFPMNSTDWTDMSSLITKLLVDESGNRVHYTRTCSTCGDHTPFLLESPTWSLSGQSTHQLLTHEIKRRFHRISDQPCVHCGSITVQEDVELNTHDPPPLIALHIQQDGGTSDNAVYQPKISATVSIGQHKNKLTYYTRGLIYWGEGHFTCRMIGNAKDVYYNDGMSTLTRCIFEGTLDQMGSDIYTARQRRLTYIILSLV